MTAPPTVSVVMAAYKGAGLVGETIDSVLAQTLQDFELIVVDDCSPDNTLDVLRGYADPRITIIAADENRGPVRTRNHAFSLARGRYIAGLDQDDLCRPERFARQVAWLDAHPETALLGCAAESLMGTRVRPPRLARTTPLLIRWLLDIVNPLAWSSVMIRGETARRLDPFTRPEILYAEDFDLYHRISALGAVARLDEPLLLYRCHEGGVSRLHRERMMASAGLVLAEAYAPLFGADAAANAALVARHLGGGELTGDRATLIRLAVILDTLAERFRKTNEIDDLTLTLIDTETARLWHRLVRASVRSGMLGLREATSVRPAAVRSDWDYGDRMVSGLVGSGRAVRARLRSAA